MRRAGKQPTLAAGLVALLVLGAGAADSQQAPAAEKSRAAWMQQGRFGLMVHWIAPGPPPQHGERITDLDAAVNRFDLAGFLEDYRRSKADWLIFTVGQSTGRYASPNKVLDRLAGPGHCSQRDLVLEIARELKKLGKRTIVYLPSALRRHRFPIALPQLGDQEFRRSYAEFIAEYSRRWGDTVDGWWFDGGSTDPAHRETMAGLLSAARAGNPNSAVAINDGSFCLGLSLPVVPGQDYLAGETEFLLKDKIRFGRGTDVLALLQDGPQGQPVFGRGVKDCIGFVCVQSVLQPPAGCLWHALVPIDCMWRHGAGFASWQNAPFELAKPEPGKMERPWYTVSDLEAVVRDLKAAGGAVTFNVGIFQEGRLGPDTIDQLEALGSRVK